MSAMAPGIITYRNGGSGPISWLRQITELVPHLRLAHNELPIAETLARPRPEYLISCPLRRPVRQSPVLIEAIARASCL